MALLDSLNQLLGPPPPRYDERLHRAVEPDPKRERTLAGHVRECTARYNALKTDMQDIRIELHQTRKLLVVIAALLILNKVIDLGQITSLLAH